MDKPLILLTMGDPAGVGPEVILKTIVSQRAHDLARLAVVGWPGPFLRDAALLGMEAAIIQIAKPSEAVDEPGVISLLTPEENFEIPSDYGIVDAACGRAAGLCIEYSARLLMDGMADAVTTAPINKESLNAGGFHFPGHTEFYQHLTGAPDIAMLLTLGDFRVIHVVTHTAIRNVPDLVTKARVTRVATLFNDAVTLIVGRKPHLAMCALNPHAGEAGMFGREEEEVLIPAANALRAGGVDITDPQPPDTVFARAYCGEFDGVVAMFHDQGHIALKLAGFKFSEGCREVGGVNTTLGLPVIRTSVDHGTAFDIAGKGIASPQSMIDAVELAVVTGEGPDVKKKWMGSAFT